MKVRTKIELVVTALLLAASFFFYSAWRDASARSDACEARAVLAVSERARFDARVGALETELEQWKARPPEVAPGLTVYVDRDRFKTLPADCRVCAEKWTLDRRYANPGPEPPKGSIEVEVRDVLGADEASWRINTNAICPEAGPCPQAPGSSRVGFRADADLGYGFAGPEAGAAVWPLVFASPKAEVAVGAWAHANLTDQGVVQGNAVLGVRVTRVGGW